MRQGLIRRAVPIWRHAQVWPVWHQTVQKNTGQLMSLWTSQGRRCAEPIIFKVCVCKQKPQLEQLQQVSLP